MKESTRHERMEEHSKLFRDMLMGFARVHVLHMASREPVYGAELSTALSERGYPLSPGTLYPMLHGMQEAGFVSRDDLVVEGKVRKYYSITPLGREALQVARERAEELLRGIDAPTARPTPKRSRVPPRRPTKDA